MGKIMVKETGMISHKYILSTVYSRTLDKYYRTVSDHSDCRKEQCNMRQHLACGLRSISSKILRQAFTRRTAGCLGFHGHYDYTLRQLTRKNKHDSFYVGSKLRSSDTDITR